MRIVDPEVSEMAEDTPGSILYGLGLFFSSKDRFNQHKSDGADDDEGDRRQLDGGKHIAEYVAEQQDDHNDDEVINDGLEIKSSAFRRPRGLFILRCIIEG